MKLFLVFILLLISQLDCLAVYDSCWAVTTLNNPAPGYIKLGWNSTFSFTLIDNYGIPQYCVENKYTSLPMSQKLMKNGLWLSYGSYDYKYYILNQDLELIDSIPVSEPNNLDLHDADVLSNGHYLLLYYQNVPVDMSKIVTDGNSEAIILNTVLIETDRTGTIYWQWNALEHMSVTDAAPDIDLRMAYIDFCHVNSFSEAPDGNIIVSFRNLDEVTKINKATGDIMWRFGGKYCKNNQFTFLNDDVDGYVGFSHQHSVVALPNGNILMFDNGTLKTPPYSRAVEYQLNTTDKTALKVWEYRSTPDLYSDVMGSAERLPNGNTLINWVNSKVIEVRPDNTIAFEYGFKCFGGSEGAIYRAYRYITLMNAVTLPITSKGTFKFTNQKFNTDATIEVTSLTGAGSISVEKHNYAPPTAVYNDSTFSEILPYRWVLSKDSVKSLKGTIRIKVSGIEGLKLPTKVKIFKRDKEASGTFVALNTSFNSSTDEISADFSGFGEFALGFYKLNVPVIVTPVNENASIPITGLFKWQKLHGATKYHIQLSSTTDFNKKYIDKTIDLDTTCEYSDLKYNSKYYWRIKALSSIDTSEWSGVNSFTTRQVPAPASLVPASGFVGLKLTDTLNWDFVVNADYYKVQLSEKEDMSTVVWDTSYLNKNFVQYYKLKFNTTYYWHVAAYQGNNASPWSVVSSFTTTLPCPVLSSPTNDTTDVPIKCKMYWESVPGANSYRIEVSEFSNFSVLKYSNNAATNNYYSFNQLESYKKYYWRVRANRNYDTSSWSDSYSFTTLPASPTLLFPNYLSINQPTDLRFAWDSITTAVSYHLQVSKEKNFNSVIIDTTGVLTASFYAEGLPADKRLYWRVTAIYKDRSSKWSNIFNFTTAQALPLSAPVLLLPANNSICSITGQFTWNQVKNATSYSIQVADNKEFVNPAIDRGDIKESGYNFTSLVYHKTYYWRVKAHSITDSSNWSETWTIKIQPGNVVLVEPGNDGMQIPVEGSFKWMKDIAAKSYQLQLSNDSLFVESLIDTVDLKDTILSYSGLHYNDYYYWRVRSVKNGVPDNWSIVFSFTTKSQYDLATPELVSPDDGTNAIPVDGMFKWIAVPDAETYRVGISKSADFNELVLRHTGIIETQYQYPVLEYNQLYYWRITAFSSNASSHWSEIRSFLTELAPPLPDAPSNNSVDQPSSGFLAWSPVSNAETYYLQVSTNDEFNGLDIDEPVLTDTNYVYTLNPGKKYYWRVKAESILNNSRWSPILCFTLASANSVNDNNWGNYSGMTIYPNPVSEVIILTGEGIDGCNYRIYSPEGIELAGGIVAGNKINTASLSSGCYFLRIGDSVLKFIKID